MSITQQDQPKEVTAAELAEKVGTDPKELRKWLRAEGLGVGAGGNRYVFTPQKAGQLAKKWAAAQETVKDAS